MIRLIARIDVRNGYHIKTVNCEGVKKIRLVEESLKYYSLADEHDELIVIDAVASLYGNPNWLLCNQVDFFYTPIPLSIGGGINSVESALKTLEKGADKIIVNSAAIENPKLIEDIASICGRQALVLQIDAKLINNDYLCLTHGARELSKFKVSEWIQMAQDNGAGEVHVTSIDSEGTDTTFPEKLAQICAEHTDLPIILSGGIREAAQIKRINEKFGINSFSFSSITNRIGLTAGHLRSQLNSIGITCRQP